MKSNFDKPLGQEYEMFKLQWMINHGHTLLELVSALDDYELECIETFLKECELYDEIDLSNKALLAEWEKNVGFNGEIYPCFKEWLNNDRGCEE